MRFYPLSLPQDRPVSRWIVLIAFGVASKVLNFVAQNWGNLASVASLVAAGISAALAGRAAKAACEAREAVLATTLAEEINIASAIAQEITTLAAEQSHSLVRLRCDNLLGRTLTIRWRWDAKLSAASKENLHDAERELKWLRSAALKLTLNPIVPTAKQLSAMQERCGQIRDIFIKEHASAMRRNDEAQNG